MHLGTANAMGPDAAKASVALQRIFGFIKYPSSINAVEMDKEEKLKRIDFDKVEGII